MSKDLRPITVALVGNPNSGKTTVFNQLTGDNQKVGNYPGVTVESKQAFVDYKGYRIKFIDLPGIYGLSASSEDEVISRKFILEQNPDLIVNVIDFSNLQRNLYLTAQLLELDTPLILNFNMADLAKNKVFVSDKNRLSQLLNSPIVFTTATKRKGIQQILEEVINVYHQKDSYKSMVIDYGIELETVISNLESVLKMDKSFQDAKNIRWLAIKILESDQRIISKIKNTSVYPELDQILSGISSMFSKTYSENLAYLVSDKRHQFVDNICKETITTDFQHTHSLSDKVDSVLLNRLFGLPVFMLIIWLMFKFTFTFSSPMVRAIEILQDSLIGLIGQVMAQGSIIYSLLVDGIIAGVGSVIVFVPIIFMLFIFMACLEYSGYMARAVFVMDRFMHKVGLHGKSFIPIILGFGCNVPAIMAARTIDNKKDRLVTILMNPFISCGARLPVYVLFIGAFFSENIAGNVLFSLYLIGFLVSLFIARILSKYLLKNEITSFAMELPSYKIPELGQVLTYAWHQSLAYLKKAGTVIFAGCIIIWALSNFPLQNHREKLSINGSSRAEVEVNNIENTYAGKLGKIIAPVFKPLGFDDWKISVSLMGGVFAKEIIIGTLGTLNAEISVQNPNESLSDKLKLMKKDNGKLLFSPLVAYSFLIFVLLYMPCLATIAVINKETGSWVWTCFSIFSSFTIAWIISFIIYQGGIFLGFR